MAPVLDPRSPIVMGRQRCKSCFALVGLCIASCKAQLGAHDHSADHSDVALLQQPSIDTSTDFTAWLGQESPEAHVQQMYQESGVSHTIFSWMLDASRGGCGTAAEGVVAEAAHVHDPDIGDPHDSHGKAATPPASLTSPTSRAALVSRRLLDVEDSHSDHDHAEDLAEDDSHDDHAHEDDHAMEVSADVAATASRVLTADSLEALDASNELGTEAVRDALAFITACLVDPACVLEGSAEISGDAHDDHDDHAEHDDHDGSGGMKHLGLKLGIAASFLAMTVAASYLPLLFMWSQNYHGILTCLNVFSGSIFLSVGLMHLLPHVAEYEEAADLGTDFPVGNAFVTIGFLLILFTEQVIFDVHGAEVEARSAEGKSSAKYALMTRASTIARRYHSPLIIEGAVVLHAVLESIVLGLSGSREDVWLLFAAICSHKVFTTMSQSTRFLRLGCPPGLLFILLLPFHLLPPLGVVLGTVSGQENSTVSLILAGLTTGTFLYVGAFEVVAEEFADSGHSPSLGGDCPACDSPCYVGADSGCIRAPVTVNDTNSTDGSEADVAGGWIPGRALKFVIFVFGCGVLFAVTAVLPSHSDVHGH